MIKALDAFIGDRSRVVAHQPRATMRTYVEEGAYFKGIIAKHDDQLEVNFDDPVVARVSDFAFVAREFPSFAENLLLLGAENRLVRINAIIQIMSGR